MTRRRGRHRRSGDWDGVKASVPLLLLAVAVLTFVAYVTVNVAGSFRMHSQVNAVVDKIERVYTAAETGQVSYDALTSWAGDEGVDVAVHSVAGGSPWVTAAAQLPGTRCVTMLWTPGAAPTRGAFEWEECKAAEVVADDMPKDPHSFTYFVIRARQVPVTTTNLAMVLMGLALLGSVVASWVWDGIGGRFTPRRGYSADRATAGSERLLFGLGNPVMAAYRIGFVGRTRRLLQFRSWWLAALSAAAGYTCWLAATGTRSVFAAAAGGFGLFAGALAIPVVLDAASRVAKTHLADLAASDDLDATVAMKLFYAGGSVGEAAKTAMARSDVHAGDAAAAFTVLAGLRSEGQPWRKARVAVGWAFGSPSDTLATTLAGSGHV